MEAASHKSWAPEHINMPPGTRGSLGDICVSGVYAVMVSRQKDIHET